MATPSSPIPSAVSAGGPPSSATASAPPNFYAQAAMAHNAAPVPDYTAQNQQFKSAVQKLLAIFDKMEKLTPNGLKIDKDIKAMADSLRATRDRVFEGEEGEKEGEGQTGAEEATGTAGATKAAQPAAGTAAPSSSATNVAGV